MTNDKKVGSWKLSVDDAHTVCASICFSEGRVTRGEGFLARQKKLKRPRGKPDNGALEQLVISSEHKDLSGLSFEAIFPILSLIHIYICWVFIHAHTPYEHFSFFWGFPHDKDIA